MLDQSRDIHLFEEHSSVLPVWWDRRDGAVTVVYLDAHLDLQKIGDDSLASLRACTSLEQVRSLEAPSHLNRSDRYAFGIENFLYAAHRLELIDRLVWVAPPHIPRHYSAALIEYVQQMDGISFDELTSFEKLGANAIRGTLLGLDITICNFDDLDSLEIDQQYYLDVDCDYFVTVPSDRLWIDPAIVIDKILAQLGNPEVVTISRAVSSGFTPLAFRYVGDYIDSLLRSQKSEFEYYRKLTAAIFKLGEGDIERGRSDCRQLIADEPELAAAQYILALVTSDLAEKQRLLDAARGNDSAYDFDLACEAIGFLHRGKSLDAAYLQQLVTLLESGKLGKSQREEAEIALAQVFAASGNSDIARALLRQQTGEYANHEDVLLTIAMGQMQNPDKCSENKAMLLEIGKGVKNATAAQRYLGDLEYASLNFEMALEHYRIAHENAPAWMLPLERMQAIYLQLGQDEKAAALERRIGGRRLRLQQIIE